MREVTQTRQYTMRTRAVAVERTREAVLRGVLDLTAHVPIASITLAAVANRAGVSVQTVLRQFGSRDALFDAAVDVALREEVEVRQVGAGDVDRALALLVERYEQVGDRMLALLDQERHEPRARAIADLGRNVHAAWLLQVFAPLLAGRPVRERRAAMDLLAVATDLYTWKLLRRDRGLGPLVVRRRMRQLVEAALTQAGTEATA